MNYNSVLADASDLTYPIQRNEFQKQCHVVIETPLGTEVLLSDLLNYEGCPEKFESQSELQATLVSQLPKEFVGRPRYDDRGTTQDFNPVSF